MNIEKVLFVDDEPDIRRIAQLSLQSVGRWRAILAASGPDGLALAAAEKPDVILLDVMMPGMDGPTILTKLQSDPATSAIPVVFMTAKAQRHEVERFLRLGARGVITKPFDPMTLPTELRDILTDDKR
jgi:two-component system OmpR family response regulator